MWLFSLVFNISLELCLLGLARFPLETPLVLDTSWRFYSKGGEIGTKASNMGTEEQKIKMGEV
jgi:hypothetical protein